MAFPTFSPNLAVNAVESGWKITQVFDGPNAVYAAERVATVGGASDDDSFLHNQPLAATNWVFAHGLPFTPAAAHIEDLAGDDVDPINVDFTATTVTIEFLVPQAGTARIS